MSRLTVPHFDGKGHYMKCSEQFGCSGECADCEELDKIVEKLAEYENKEEKQPQTNADRIRAMSDEELAVFIHEPFCDKRTHEECTISYCGVCNQCALDWLQQPAEGEKDGRAVLHGLPG